MDYDHEIRSLAAETLALTAIVGFVFRQLMASDPDLADTIAHGFDDAADFVERFAIKTGTAAPAHHTVKALRVVEEIRTVTMGGKSEPKHGV